MTLNLEQVKEKLKIKKLSQEEFENFAARCEADDEYEDFLKYAAELGVDLEAGQEEKVMVEPEGDNYYSEEIIEQYFHEIALYEHIKSEDEDAIIEKAQKGDEDARELLVTSNLKLVAKIAMKYSKSGTNYIDLIQDGTIGLIKAIDKYDMEKGYNFSSYAVWWVKREIINAIVNRINAIKIPNYVYLQNRKLQIFENDFHNEFNKNPTLEEISSGLGIELEEVEKLKAAGDLGVTRVTDESEEYLGDYNTVELIEKELEALEERTKVSSLLKKVSYVERKVVEMYFGLGEEGKCNLKEISNELEISVDKVKLLKDRALTKLKFAGERLSI